MASLPARRSLHCRPLVVAVVAALTATLAWPAATASASLPAPSSVPAVVSRPKVGPPQSPLTVTATGFGAGQRVTIKLGAIVIGSGLTTRAGTLTLGSEVPASALPGNQTITATTKSRSASGGFLVRTNWPEQRFGPSNRADNFRENVLTAATAANLTLVASGPTTMNGGNASLVDGILYFNDPSNLDTVAMDAASHTVLWTTLPGGQASGAPAVDHGLVFVNNLDGGFVAFNATDGSLAWSGLSDSFFRAPAFANGIVYAQGRHGLYALDETTGNIIWQDPYGGNSSVPAIVNGVLYAGTGGGVYALNPATGAVLWQFPGVDAGTVSYANNNLYFNSFTNQLTSTVYSITLTGTRNWATVIPSANDPVLADGRIYLQIGGNALEALNLADGSVAWTTAYAYIGSSSPALANGVLYIGADHGVVDAINDATGAVVATVTVPGNNIYGQPIIANGNVYIGASNDGMLTLTTTTPPAPTAPA